MSVLAAINEQHRKFHADIARRAALVRPKPSAPTTFVPNTPYGVKKHRPMLPVKREKNPENIEPYWWHCMWFFDLIHEHAVMDEPRSLQVRDIQIAVCRKFGVSLVELLAERRLAKLVHARQVAMYLAKTLTLRSLPEIGRRFGGRDHTTVLHAVRKIERLIESDLLLSSQIAELKSEMAS